MSLFRKVTVLTFLFSVVLFAMPRTTNASDFFHHPMRGDPSEFWRYQFVLDNGTEAYLTFSLLQVPTMGDKAAVELSFRNFKGKNVQVGRQFERKDWKEIQQPLMVKLRSDYRMEGMPGPGHRAYFATTKNEGFFLDLTFDSALPSAYEPPSEGSPFHLAIHIPRGSVRGRIAVGKDTIAVKGKAVLMHTWHNKKVTTFAKKTISLFAPGEGGFTGAFAIGSDGKIHGFGLQIKGLESQLVQLSSFNQNGKVITLNWLDTQQSSLTIDLSKAQQKYSTLATIDSWMEKQAAKMAMGGERILLRGTTQTNLGPQKWVGAGFP